MTCSSGVEILRSHQLFLKKSKCNFGETRMAYLGHVITATGVAVDEVKVQAVLDWPEPHLLRPCKGFWGWRVTTGNLSKAMGRSQLLSPAC